MAQDQQKSAHFLETSSNFCSHMTGESKTTFDNDFLGNLEKMSLKVWSHEIFEISKFLVE